MVYNLLYSLDIVSDVSMISDWFLFGLLLCKGVANKADTSFVMSLEKKNFCRVTK